MATSPKASERPNRQLDEKPTPPRKGSRMPDPVNAPPDPLGPAPEPDLVPPRPGDPIERE